MCLANLPVWSDLLAQNVLLINVKFYLSCKMSQDSKISQTLAT